ncbi:MAG TPA: mechanosensitive ion channel family protein, partial [Actinomycetes bacterium]|nr:mechanosensitive ion channel family protein [Actinomycetes bacterium]
MVGGRLVLIVALITGVALVASVALLPLVVPAGGLARDTANKLGDVPPLAEALPDPAQTSVIYAADGKTALATIWLDESFGEFGDGFVHRLPYLLAATVALVLTLVAARLVRSGVERALRRGGAEHHVVVVVETLAFYAVAAVGLVVALSLGGVNLGVLVGSLGLATVALGFALQDIVSNFSAGIVLLLEHPFTEGDYIAIAEAEGEVEDIRVRATRLRAPDGQLVIVPNKLLFTQVLTNSTATTRRRVEVALEVPYGQDATRARQLLLAAAAETEGVSDDPAPRLLTQDLGQGARSL